ncbi:MAG: hypothetical protein JWO38_6970 [Gemmataceae bacterium]|nr:hypothetical protein [Gemmataceae bacterium]
MKRVFAVVTAVVMVGLAGAAPAPEADDNAKKIVGKWEVSKSGSDIPAGSTIEFSKDGKLSVLIKEKEDVKIEGTFKVEKEKLTVKLKVADQTLEETVTIQKLTDDALELKDKDGKVDVLKKSK